MADFLPDLRSAVDRRTSAALEEHVGRLAHLGPALDELLSPARALLRGGKRLRAQLCGAGWLAAGAQADPAHPVLVHAGAALELFQACALVHDDVIDAAQTRRGLPAAHRALAAAHRDNDRLGDADRFGISGAIVLGDLLLSAASAELALATARVPEGPARAGREVFDHMGVEVAVGQYLDVRAEHLAWDGPEHPSGQGALEAALSVVRHKSARYSVEHPIALGAALGGADHAHIDALREVGLPFGEAFQLRDDVIGVFGEPATTGKPAGDDLREGKRTALLALTLGRLDEAAAGGDGEARERAARLRSLVGDPDLTADEVDDIRAIMTGTGAFDDHERLVAARRDAGHAALDRADVPDRARAVLADLGEMLTTRTF